MQGTVSVTVEETNPERSIPDCPERIVLGRQAHWLPAQGLTQVNPLSLPLDLAIGAYPPHRRLGLVLWGTQPAGVGAWRRAVPPSWGLLAQGFMGALLIVAGTKGLEGSLLLQPVGLGRTRCLRFQRPVEPFQPPVLFWMSGLDTLWEDPQLDPPHGQGRQSPQSHTGKGRAVGGAYGLRKDVFSESPSRTSRTSDPRGWRSPWHTRRYREAASAAVRGLTRTPSPVRNQPLKSMHHRSLGCSA